MMRAMLVGILFILATQGPSFEPVQPELFRDGGALTDAWADYDGDGDLDLFVGFNGAPNRLYRNGGSATAPFHDVADSVGLARARATRAAAWGDYDGDGDPDLLLGFAPGPAGVLELRRNDGGRFTDVTAAAGITADSGSVRQPSWVDYDQDGDLDLFVAMRDRPNLLFRNDGARFAEIAATVGLADPRKSVGAVWFDYDEDGDLDLYVANQDGHANGLFRNERGRFADVAEAAGAAWAGRPAGVTNNGTVRPCVADVNDDGHLDLFAANYGPNGLLLNRGDGRFEDVSAAWGVASDGRYDTCDFADFDADGRVDLYVNGTFTANTSYRDYLFRNTGSTFEDVTPANLLALNASHGARWADFDGDLDPDLAIAGVRPDATHAVYRNTLTPPARGAAIEVDPGTGPGALPPGSEVRVYDAATNRLLGVRLVDTGSGYNSQSSQPLHFGLGARRRIDVEVVEMSATGRRVRRLGARDSGAGRIRLPSRGSGGSGAG